jgi:hypothetical protein
VWEGVLIEWRGWEASEGHKWCFATPNSDDDIYASPLHKQSIKYILRTMGNINSEREMVVIVKKTKMEEREKAEFWRRTWTRSRVT